MKKLYFLCFLFSSLITVFFQGARISANAESSRKNAAVSSDQYYHIQKHHGLSYLKNDDGTPGQGWYVKFNAGFRSLGSLKDIKLFRKHSFHLVHAGKKGLLKTDEDTENFYFDERGYLADSTGLFKLRGQYYFLKDGMLQTKDTTYKKKTYYMNLNGTVAGYQKGARLYSCTNRKKMSSIAKRDFQTRSYAREIILSTVNTSMSENEKLQACFQWVVKHYSYADVPCNGEKGWTSKSGETMLRNGIGDCRGLAVGFAYLASELGFKETYLCQDSINVFSGSHCWTSVNGRYYDPLFYNSKRPTRYLAVFNGSTPEEYYKKTHCTASQKFKPGD